MMTFQEFAESVQLDELLVDRPPLILMDDSFTVKEAIKILSTQKILSAPVLSGPVAPSRRNFLGFIDVLDILSYCISLYPPNSLDKHLSLSEMWKIGRTFALTPIDQVINHSQRDPVEPIEHTCTLWQLLEKMRVGIHRIPITKDSTFIGIITQSDVIRFLSRNLQTLGPLGSQTIAQLGLVNRRLDAISSDHLAVEAFKYMFEHKRSALAVVVPQNPAPLSPASQRAAAENPRLQPRKPGELVGSLSASEIRKLFPGQFDPGVHALSKLNAPVMKFLENTVQQSPNTLSVCTDDWSLTMVIMKLLADRVHRLWIVTPENIPVGVISLTDIINSLLVLTGSPSPTPSISSSVTSS